MNKKHARKSFADIVRAVESTPKRAEPPRTPGRYADAFVDKEDRQYELAHEDISPGRALEAAQAGAQLVWDACGCGGYCDMTWYTAEDMHSMVNSGQPSVGRTKRHRGRISEWRSMEGSTLLLAEGWVIWDNALV